MNADHVVIYAHHARAEQLPAFVLVAIKGLLEVADHVVLVAAGADTLSIPDKLGDRVSAVCRPNRGWDFASYRDGIAFLGDASPARITLCNDSVYGPLFSLAPAFARMERSNTDVWGMTASSELHWHLQSYFLSFRETALRGAVFRRFWASVSDEALRREVIRSGEVGLSQQLMGEGLALEALYTLSDQPALDASLSSPTSLSTSELVKGGLRSLGRRWRSADFYRDVRDVLLEGARPGRNPSLEHWSQLVAEQGLPWVKRSVLKESPQGLLRLEAALAGSSGAVCEEAVQALRSDLNN